MDVSAAAAFSDVHLSDKKDTDDFFLQAELSASLCLHQQTGHQLEAIEPKPSQVLLMVESHY